MQALGVFRRSPAFTTAAVLALGLGIGANAAICSVVDAVLLRPLPYPDADQLVMVWEEASYVGFPRNTPAPANWVDWRARNSVIGIYGVLACSVTQRTREIGLRMAVGATAGGISAMVLRQGMGLVAGGLALGIAGALAATRALSGLLYGVAPTDPRILGAVAVLLGSIAAVACWIPARRAAAIDPLAALRDE